MNTLPVRIITLPAIRVASVHGFGREPEAAAWQKLTAWAAPRGLLDKPEEHRIFGFNNPNPAPGTPNYGYEFWITVDESVTADDEVTIKEFPGGLYAVTRCEVTDDPGNRIPAMWQALVRWREASQYKGAHHQWLEEHISTAGMPAGGFVLDLYLPIAA
jgi:DNA gyrase inhibitor GyrI